MFSYKDIVKYSSVDKNGNMPLYEALEQFQNCINLHAIDIKQDFESMQKRDRAWVLISWKIKLYKPIKIYDEIEIGTWSHAFNKMFGSRAYIMLDSEGNSYIEADTKWVLISLETRNPQRVEAEDLAGYATGEPIEGLSCSRKMKLEGEKSIFEPVKVLKTYIDTNGHMNNTAYFRLAEEYLPEGYEYNTVEAMYVKETTQGMMLIPCMYKNDGYIGISFESEDGATYTQIKYYTE